MSVPYMTEPRLRGSFTVADVTVVDPADGSRTPHRDIRVENGVIAAIEPAAEHDAGDRDTVVDGTGRHAVPAFVDAHAHPLNTPAGVEASYALMLANGVCGYRQMSGSPRILSDRAAGRLPTPLGAPELLATPGELLTPLNAGTPETATAEAREQQRQGADFLKAGMVGVAAFLPLLEESRRLGIPLAGHLPSGIDPRDVARGGMRCIEHLGPGASIYAASSSAEEALHALQHGGRPLPSLRLPGMGRIVGRIIAGLVVNPAALTSETEARGLVEADDAFDEEKAGELAALFVEHETWQCPTLIRLHTQQFPDAPEHEHDPRARYIHPAELKRWRKATRRFRRLPSETRDALRAHWAAQLRMTRLLAEAGVPMLAGTDANGAGWVIPGFALHDEFDLLAEAGLEPLAILRMTTVAPARFLGREDSAGRLRPGTAADLVLLGGDPVDDHRALHAIDAVARDGRLWDRAELDGILSRVAADPTAR